MADWPSNVKLANDRKRRFILLGHIVRGVATLDASPPKITMPSNPSLEKWLREPGTVPKVETLKEDLEALIRIAKDYPNTAFPTNVSVILAPVEFIYAAILVHRCRRQLTLEQLALAIRDMRMTVRKEHPDIRTNTKVSKSLDKFVMDEVPYKLGNGEYGYQPTTVPVKRKRVADVNEYETDNEYVDATAAMDISGDERTRGARKKRTPGPGPSPVKRRKSPADSAKPLSPTPPDFSSSKAASSIRGNPVTNASPMRPVGPFGRF